MEGGFWECTYDAIEFSFMHFLYFPIIKVLNLGHQSHYLPQRSLISGARQGIFALVGVVTRFVPPVANNMHRI